MPERELEQVMLDFHRQRFNVLVCTTIIESGIDIPNANTIVINRADRFGLAQLHQLRGRVGRSHHRAYAYLVVPDQRSDHRRCAKAPGSARLAGRTRRRLHPGHARPGNPRRRRTARRGPEPARSQEIGFSLYTELLERAVRALKQRQGARLRPAPATHEAEVELHMPALIPDDYLPDVHARLTLYKRIASARDDDELRELQVEMIDRFGLLPDPAKHLFAVAELKLRRRRSASASSTSARTAAACMFRPQPNVDPMTIIKLIQSQPRVYALDGQDKLRLKMPLEGTAERLRAANDLLRRLARARLRKLVSALQAAARSPRPLHGLILASLEAIARSAISVSCAA